MVSGDRVFVHARVGGDEVVSAHGLADGRAIWTQRQPVAYTPMSAAAGHGAGPKSTPLLHQGRLYTFGAGGALSCFDAATGRVAWRKDFAGRFKEAWPLFGVAQSPVADGNQRDRARGRQRRAARCSPWTPPPAPTAGPSPATRPRTRRRWSPPSPG